MIKELEQCKDIIKIVASNPLKQGKYRKVVLRPVQLGGEPHFQAEMFSSTQVFHENIAVNDLEKWVDVNIVGKYKQICIVMKDKDVTYLTSEKGKTTRFEKTTPPKTPIARSNNRQKKYILNEGDDVPAMVDLGIFTKEGKVVVGMYDKFKQINRFVEIVDDVLSAHSGKLTLLDFGCGKSYLTFIVYHYLVNVRNIDARIIGYDLKADVVANCNALARKYGYENLQFEVADVSKDKLYDEHIDAVLSLHACDTATDYALNFAIKHNVPYIFSVPWSARDKQHRTQRSGRSRHLVEIWHCQRTRFCAVDGFHQGYAP